jgi:tRNA modification GTPase
MGIDPDTIVAIATPAGRGAVGVVRLSGDRVGSLLERHLRWHNGRRPPPRTLGRARFVDGSQGAVDEVLAAYFPGPRSYTGEDVAEIHGHGSPVLLEAIVDGLIASGARLARPGEFTERAFLAGKIDLTQAEAVQALVAARSRNAAALAERLLDGALGERIRRLQEAVVDIQAEVEAGIDFVEEELDIASAERLAERLARVTAEVDRLLAGYAAGRRLLGGVRVALVGATNAGKSSLFNELLGEDRSIVTPEAGTTRDYVEVEVEWQGLAVHLIDTAGLRSGTSTAEVEGVNRSRQEARRADLLLHVVDGCRPEVTLELAETQPAIPTLMVWNKIDVGPPPPNGALGGEVVAASAVTGEGVERIRRWITASADGRDGGDEEALLCLPRQREAVARARCGLAAARGGLVECASPELVAFELREAQEALGEVVGSKTPDDVLAAIFSRFCIGK